MKKYRNKRVHNFSTEVFARAAADVESGMSIRRAARKYQVDKTTLSRYLRRPSETFGYDNLRQKKQIFSNEMESNLASHIIDLCKMFHGISKKRCQEIAYEYALRNSVNVPENWKRDRSAGRDWYEGFRARHNLALRSPEATSLARATAFNRHSVGEFFKNLAEVMDKFKFSPSDIFNVDESGFHTVQRPGNVLAPKGIKQVGSITSAERGQLVTMICTISATGNAISPVYIFPRVRYYNHFVNGAPTGSIGCCSGNGWVNEKIFVETYIPHLIQHTRCSEEHKILLILDNHVSHVSLDLIENAKNNGIVLLTITPHTSHKLQPLDVAIFGPFKSLYNSAMDGWLRSNPGKTVTIYDIPSISAVPYHQALTQSNIINGFRKTGIYPFNEHIFEDCDFAPSFVSDRDDPNLEEVPNQTQPSQDHVETSSEPSTSYVAPQEVLPLPKKGARVQKGRKRKKSAILTSTPFKNALAKEKNKRTSRNNKTKRKIVPSESESDESCEVAFNDTTSEEDELGLVIGDWVLVTYEGEQYPGEVTDVVGHDVRVNVMRKAGRKWKWPDLKDEIFYDESQVVKRLAPPVVAGARGQFTFCDM